MSAGTNITADVECNLLSDQSNVCTKGGNKQLPPPIPKTPPHAGRILTLKYYKKVSKSIAKLKRPGGGVSSTSNPNSNNSPSSPESSILSPSSVINPIDHVYEIIPQHNKMNSTSSSTASSSSFISSSPETHHQSSSTTSSSLSQVDRRDSSATNDSCVSEYGSAEEGLDTNDSPDDACSYYENVEFSSHKKLATTDSGNTDHGNELINKTMNSPSQNDNEDEDDEDDSSKWDKSSESTHIEDSSLNVITTIQNTTAKPTTTTTVHRTATEEGDDTIPPRVPKFPSSTEESSSADDSFSSCTSKPGNTTAANPLLCTTTAEGIATETESKSVLALSQQKTNESLIEIESCTTLSDLERADDETNAEKTGLAKNKINRVGVGRSAAAGDSVSTSSCSSVENEDDTRAPEDYDDEDDNDDANNDADDEIIDLDEESFNGKTTSEEIDLVQAVTQTLTLTLNNQSNSLFVSIPSSSSSSSVKGSCPDLPKGKNYIQKFIRRPETGPGNDDDDDDVKESQHEYQNVFVRSGRIISRPIDHNDETSDEEAGEHERINEGDDDDEKGEMMSINRVILSESGVTRIEEGVTRRRHRSLSSTNNSTTIASGQNENEEDEEDAVPIVHAVINLPPRMMNLIKQRRRRTEEQVSYEKSSRLSRLMMADFKAGEKRPASSILFHTKSDISGGHSSGATGDLPSPTGSSGGGGVPEVCKAFATKAKLRLSSTGSKVTSNVERVGKSVSTMRRKVGSWYQKRVKTPVKQLSTELGIDMTSNANSFNNKEESFKSFITSSSNISVKLNGSSSTGNNKSTVDVTTDLDFDEGDYSIVTGEYSLSSEVQVSQQQQQQSPDINEDEDTTGLMKKGQNEFEDLRRLVKQGGDFCKDLSAVLLERSELESQYAKGLSKLSAKLLKASKEATGSVAHAWQAVAVQIDTQAELHRQWSTALSEELAKPLKNSTDTQHKIRKSVEVLVEKTTRNLADWRTAEAKAKRQCFSSSKEFEKLQESSVLASSNKNSSSVSNGNNNAHNNANANNNATNGSNSVLSEVRSRSRLLTIGVPPLDKDPLKLEAKRRKAEEAVRRADIEYYTFCVRSERARLEWEGAIRNGSTCLRTLEEEKTCLLRDLALKYFHNLNDFAPKLVQSVETLDEPLKNCSVDQDMHSIVGIRRHVGAEQLLPDFYAEDMTNLMNKDRRLEALQKFLHLITQDLEREKKGATGVETLAKAIAEGPKVDLSHHDISDKLYYMRSMLLYLEASRCKLDNAVCDVEGRPRSKNPVTQYMRHQRDKQGLPQTILKVPSWAREDCLTFSSNVGGGNGSAGSSSPDWTDRSNGDGVSGQHETDFDEFGSEGSENVEVFEDDNNGGCEAINNRQHLIDAPSIGKCRAIYDYDANLFDELTIRIGDEINIHDKQEDGWCLGELRGVVGIFPATYVEEIPSVKSPSISD